MMWMMQGPQVMAVHDQVRTQAMVVQLVENGARYEAALPSLSCDESIVSQVVKKDKVKEEVRIESTIRVNRTGDEREPFREKHEFKTRNGKDVSKDTNYKVPYYVSGGFANGLGFSSLERMACFDVTLTDESAKILRMTMLHKTGTDNTPECAKSWPGMSKIALIDKESGHVTHIERTIPAEYANRFKEVPFAALDYAPTLLGAETFWLPVRGSMHDEKDEGRMTVTYSGCKRFTGTSRIIGDIEKVPEP